MHIQRLSDEMGPEKIIEVYDPKTKLRGILVIDNTALGVAKGGIRMTPHVTVEEIFALARTMTWKCAMAQLPFGGGKSGIVADPKQIPLQQKYALIEALSKALRHLCPSEYIGAPDVNTGEKEMEVFAKANGNWRACTGKPHNLCFGKDQVCGIPHEIGSTGYGVAVSAEVAARHIGLEMEGASVSIEGFGNVGSFSAKHLSEKGAKLVAVSDSRGCIFNPKGIDFKKLLAIKRKTGTVIKYPGKVLPNQKLFALPTDILIPSALSYSINEGNADKIRAKLVVEAANIPATHKAEKMLDKNCVLVIPDFVANAGGVISSYSELRGIHPKDMFGLVEKKISASTRQMLDIAIKKGIMPREAALEIARPRVLKAMRKKGRI